jgi:hypothetical protein
MTLTEFLRARIARDREIALLPTNHWTECPAPRDGECTCSNDVAVWNRRRMAECEAKRRIVERYEVAERAVWNGDDVVFDYLNPESVAQALIACLMDLATVYADHPDYDEEWANE